MNNFEMAIAGRAALFKRLMNIKAVQYIIASLLAAYMGLVRRTTHWQIEGKPALKALQDSGEGFIICTWHSRFLMGTAGWSKMPQKPHILISKSRDGDLVALTSKILGLGVIRGSRKAKYKDKNKRGAGALRDMINVLQAGDCIFMTPDGPKGPRQIMSEGAIRLAKLSGAPIIAYGISTKRHKLFNSWDRFMLPFPFSRGHIVFSGPVKIAANAQADDIENARQQLETMLNKATYKCDKSLGIEPVLPAQKEVGEK